MLDLRVPKRTLKRIERELQREQKQIGRVIARSLNRAMITGRKLASQAIREELSLKAGYINQRLKIRKATTSKHEARISIQRRPIPAAQYPHSVNRTGVSVKFYKTQGRIKFKGAFKATMPNGHVGIYRRKGRARLPIKEIYGPNLADKFREVVPLVEPFAQIALEKELERNLKYFSGRA